MNRKLVLKLLFKICGLLFRKHPIKHIPKPVKHNNDAAAADNTTTNNNNDNNNDNNNNYDNNSMW